MAGMPASAKRAPAASSSSSGNVEATITGTAAARRAGADALAHPGPALGGRAVDSGGWS